MPINKEIYQEKRQPGCCGCQDNDPEITLASYEYILTMPPVLERCIAKVKKDLKEKNPDMDPKEIESRAWAICRASLKLKAHQEGKILTFQSAEKLRASTQSVKEGLRVHGPDPTRTWNLRKEYTRDLVRLIRKALGLVLENIPYSINLSQEGGEMVQFQGNIQTTLDQWTSIFNIELVEASPDIIERYTQASYSRGKTQTIRDEKTRDRTVEDVPPPAIIPTFSPDAQTIGELEALSFDLVKGVNDDIAKDLSRIIRANALGQWDRLKVRQEIVQAIQGTENFKSGTPQVVQLMKYENRAKMIAHTETVRAFNAGAMSRIASVSNEFELITADNPCPICEREALANPHQVGDPNAPIPPLHPRCQCTVGPYFGV